MFWTKYIQRAAKVGILCLSASLIQNQNRDNFIRLQEISKSNLYAWGWNNFGQLGLGHSNNSYIPQRVVALDSQQIKEVACNGSASAIVTHDGVVYTWGRSKGGILGHQTSENNLNIPTEIEQLRGIKIVKISCGNNHMAAIAENGDVYTWGNPDHGKLGHSFTPTTQEVSKRTYNTKNAFNKSGQVQRVQINKKIQQVTCGNQYTVLLADDGKVLVFGLNKKGSLGFKSEQTEFIQPIEINLPEKIVKVDSGTDFTLALGESGKLYAWGSNYFGQLGSPNPTVYETPQVIHGFESGVKIREFSCGEQFVGAIDTNGRLYTWGYGNDGQLGQLGRQDIPVPRVVEFEHKVQKISCGIGHVGVITQEGKLFMFGRGKEGQLGRGNVIESPNTYHIRPQIVEYLKTSSVIDIACGGSHTIAILS